MAESSVDESGTSSTALLQYFCHQCACSIELTPSDLLKELACPKCEGGFIEEVSPGLEETQPRSDVGRRRSSDFSSLFAAGGFLSDRRGSGSADLSNIFSNVLFSSSTAGGGWGGTRSGVSSGSGGSRNFFAHTGDGGSDSSESDGEVVKDDEEGEEAGGTSEVLFGHRGRGRDGGAEGRGLDSSTALPSFLEQFLSALTGGRGGRGAASQSGGGAEAAGADFPPPFPFLSNSLVHSDPRDYAWGSDGLDNVITQLLNQLDGAGPEPATTEMIESLPIININQQQIDISTQCSVCMEMFVLDEVVHSLPCNHVYHKDCIAPWLQLHATCPVCRLALANPAAAPASNPPSILPWDEDAEDRPISREGDDREPARVRSERNGGSINKSNSCRSDSGAGARKDDRERTKKKEVTSSTAAGVDFSGCLTKNSTNLATCGMDDEEDDDDDSASLNWFDASNNCGGDGKGAETTSIDKPWLDEYVLSNDCTGTTASSSSSWLQPSNIFDDVWDDDDDDHDDEAARDLRRCNARLTWRRDPLTGSNSYERSSIERDRLTASNAYDMSSNARDQFPDSNTREKSTNEISRSNGHCINPNSPLRSDSSSRLLLEDSSWIMPRSNWLDENECRRPDRLGMSAVGRPSDTWLEAFNGDPRFGDEDRGDNISDHCSEGDDSESERGEAESCSEKEDNGVDELTTKTT